MKNEICSKVIRIGMIDAKLSIPLFFKLDLNNIMPTIRQERICYIEYFMSAGQFRRQPIINIILELPDEGWRYVRSWDKPVGDNPRKILELNRATMDQPQQLICEIMRTWNDCEKLWIQHIEETIRNFEQNASQAEAPVSRVLQFSRK